MPDTLSTAEFPEDSRRAIFRRSRLKPASRRDYARRARAKKHECRACRRDALDRRTIITLLSFRGASRCFGCLDALGKIASQDRHATSGPEGRNVRGVSGAHRAIVGSESRSQKRKRAAASALPRDPQTIRLELEELSLQPPLVAVVAAVGVDFGIRELQVAVVAGVHVADPELCLLHIIERAGIEVLV